VEVLDANGATVSEQKYWPYGGTRSATEVSETDMRFTGQREEPGVDPALGLYNYRARFYSTVMGRFVSADPITVDGLNRYAYAKNNPLRYTDPSGHCINSDGCDQSEILTILRCGFQHICPQINGIGWDALSRVSLAVMREGEFGSAVRRFARLDKGFDRIVRGIRRTEQYWVNDSMVLDSAKVLVKGPHYIPALKDARGKGRLRTISLSYSYLDLIVMVGGEAKRSRDNWIAEHVFADAKTHDLALEANVSLNFGNFRGGTRNSESSSYYRTDIEFEDLRYVQVYGALVVKQTGDVYGSFQEEGPNRSSVHTFLAPGFED